MLADDRPILCFDIGGTSVKYGLFDVIKDKLRYLGEISTSLLPDRKTFEKLIYDTFLPHHSSVSALGFACTGRITKDCKVGFWGPFKFIEKVNFTELAGRMQCPAAALNDVSAAAYGEMRTGGNSALKNFLFISIGTGIGGGIIIDGKLFDGQHGFAGEFGIGTVYDSRQKEYYKIEALCAGRAIAADFGLEISELKNQTSKRLWSVAKDNFSYLATAIQNAVYLLDLDTVVLGGGISELLFPYYKKELEKSVVDLRGKAVKVRKARHGFKAGLVGIGFYAKDQLLEKEKI